MESRDTYIVTAEVVDGGFGEHGHVLELGLAEGRAVGGDEDQLGLSGADGLHGGLGAHGDLAGLHDEGEAGGEAGRQVRADS